MGATTEALSHPGHVWLKGGLSVPVRALQVVWDLEARGFSLTLDEAGLLVTPAARLTPADDHAIRTHRDAIVAIVEYVEKGVPQ